MKELKEYIIEGFTKTDPKRLSGITKWRHICGMYIGAIDEFSYKGKEYYSKESWKLFNDYILNEILTDKEKEKFAKVKDSLEEGTLKNGDRPITPIWVANYLASLVYHFGLNKLYSKFESWEYKNTIVTVPKKADKEKYDNEVDELIHSVSNSMKKVVNWDKPQK